MLLERTMVRVVVAARTNRVSARLPLIVSDYLIGYLLGGDDGACGDGTLPPGVVGGRCARAAPIPFAIA